MKCAFLVVGLSAAIAIPVQAGDQGPSGRRTITTAFRATSRVIITGTSSDGRDVLGTCGGRPMLDVVGAGLVNLMGGVKVLQSHCLNSDGTFDSGVFKFVGPAPGGVDSGDCDPGQPAPDGDCIVGQYRGRLVPTFNASFGPPPAPPAGVWLVSGELCYESGSGRFAGVVNDCRKGRYSPARGITSLNPDPDIGYAELYGSGPIWFRDGSHEQ